jgi:hemerythrin
MSTQKINEIVSWSQNYTTGINLIDVQHRELVILTNNLYNSCLNNKEGIVFKDAMHHMVEYVRHHFSAEIELLKKINYPEIFAHKKEHENLVKSILSAVKNYEAGKKFVPNIFVRELKDWIFGHIAISDKLYSSYITEQKRRGLLSESQIEC